MCSVDAALLEPLDFTTFTDFGIEQMGQQESGKMALWSHTEQWEKKAFFPAKAKLWFY